MNLSSYRYTIAITLAVFALAAASAHAQMVIGPGNPPCAVFSDQPQCLDPVLIIPGLGASYNSKVMLKDQTGGTWKFAPLLDWYDPLIERLEAEGYTLGTNLFVVHYDWRQPNTQSASTYLKPAIDTALNTANPESGKVDIVAHSMGGLVARAYAQSDTLYDNNIDQLIFLGTPNEGAAGAYVAWEGGKFPTTWSASERLWIGRIEDHLKKTRNQTDAKRPQTFREFFPSLKELLPINPYIEQNGSDLAIADMQSQNEFLQELADTADRLDERGIRVATIAGDTKNTLASIPVGDSRTEADITLERWRDGHPAPDPPVANSTAGDQTVLVSSVNALNGSSTTLADTLHGELPSKAQTRVVQLLRNATRADEIPVHLASAAVGVDVLSPVMPTITGPGGLVLSSTHNDFGDHGDFDWDPDDPNGPKVLTISDPPPGAYTVVLTGLDDGDYTVITSYVDSDETTFQEFSGTATPALDQTYTFTVTDTDDHDGTLTVDLPDDPNDAPDEDDSTTEPPISEENNDEKNDTTTEQPLIDGSAGNNDSTSDDPGHDGDCCPGPDLMQPAPKKQLPRGRVLGARSNFLPLVAGKKLVPYINSLHRVAYGRNPTAREHAYWLSRVTANHFARADRLLGAMQWHALHRIHH